MKTVVIIGAGPAGLAAAECLSGKRDIAVIVYDRMPTIGRKFLMAGRGGLNLTHSEDFDRFLTRYGPARTRLEPFLSRFPPASLQVWAESLGHPTFIGSSGRIFPKELKASPLLRSWRDRLARSGVTFRTRHCWQGWDTEGRLLFRDSEGIVHRETAEATILALGGASWPKLGSTGQWVESLTAQGISVIPLQPANCGFAVAWSAPFIDRFEGQPLKTIAISHDNQRVLGEAVITRLGIEGGAVYAVSRPLREALLRHETGALLIDLKPDISLEKMARRLEAPRHGQSAATFLRKAIGLPPIASNLLREAVGMALPNTPRELAGLIKNCPIPVRAPYPIDKAISTAGGIAWEELDEKLMMRKLPGVFAAGEMIDWEAPTGGYLLQACFATGFAAGEGALAWLGGTLSETADGGMSSVASHAPSKA